KLRKVLSHLRRVTEHCTDPTICYEHSIAEWHEALRCSVPLRGQTFRALALVSDLPSSRGSRTMNSLPFPGPSLLPSPHPPCSSAMFRTMVSPRPSPPWARSSVRSD